MRTKIIRIVLLKSLLLEIISFKALSK